MILQQSDRQQLSTIGGHTRADRRLRAHAVPNSLQLLVAQAANLQIRHRYAGALDRAEGFVAVNTRLD